MTKTRPAGTPKDWKLFTLATGEKRWLPSWANEPLKFDFDPDEALYRGVYVKVTKDLDKTIIPRRKSRN